MCNWHLVLPTFISHRWAYPDKIHSRCRKITAINKKARVTGINKRNCHNLYKGAPQEITKCLKLTEHKTRGQKCWALTSLSLICCAKLSRSLCSFMFQLFSHETGLLAFSSGEGETLRPVWKCLNEYEWDTQTCIMLCRLHSKGKDFQTQNTIIWRLVWQISHLYMAFLSETVETKTTCSTFPIVFQSWFIMQAKTYWELLTCWFVGLGRPYSQHHSQPAQTKQTYIVKIVSSARPTQLVSNHLSTTTEQRATHK